MVRDCFVPRNDNIFFVSYFCLMHLLVKSLHDLDAVASQILFLSPNNRIFLFYGEMGAGKTTLIKSLCKQLGTADNIASPTFSIVNEYKTGKESIYHFDFYRLKTQTEALDMGFEEYLYSGNYCFIEWPEKIPDLLPLHYISIKISVESNNERQITVDQI
jgi:tRNA threonylcarbamoyladenosine biosynthesis protein TsaE